MLIALESIKTDGGTQSRAALNEAVVADYAELILAGTDLPPVTVFHDGKAHWLADGFHRYHAHRKAYAAEIDADVRTGTRRDAILFSVGANASHGLRRTNEDKRCSVKTLVDDKEWGKWSDREIAKACGVSVPFVGAIRRPEVAQKQQENRASHAAGCNPITPPQVDEGDNDPVVTATTSRPPVAPQPALPPAPVHDATRVAELEAEVERLRNELAEARQNADELSFAAQAAGIVDEGSAGAAAEITRLLAKLATTESQRDGHMRTVTELQRTVKAAQRKVEKLEREVATLKAGGK